ncbi:MAG: nitroreductase family protein [Angelakisella sp.]
MNAVIKSLYHRQSVRAFQSTPIPEALREELFRCAAAAPTAGNQQLYTILDITEEALKQKLAVSCDNQSFIATAPMVLVFLADGTRWERSYRLAGAEPREPGPGDVLLAIADACIAAQNVVIAAESMGLGSCYIGDILEQCELHRELLGFPEYCMPACMLVLGYPDKEKLPAHKPPRFDTEYFVCQNRYRVLPDEALVQMYEKRAKSNGATVIKPFNDYMQAFCTRKYNSDFSREMNRSAGVYLRKFMK